MATQVRHIDDYAPAAEVQIDCFQKYGLNVNRGLQESENLINHPILLAAHLSRQRTTV
jgi:hypothetical protein